MSPRPKKSPRETKHAHVDSIPTAIVNIPFQIALGSIWNALFCHTEESPVCEQWFPMDGGNIKSITTSVRNISAFNPTKNFQGVDIEVK